MVSRWQALAIRGIVVVIGIAGLTIAVLVFDGTVEPDAAAAGALIGLICLLLLVLLLLPPADIDKYLGRVKNVSLGSLGVELSDYRSLAEQRRETGDGEDSLEGEGEPDEDSDVRKSLLGLRLLLEAKLTYLAKHVLAPDPGPEHPVATFLTVGSLQQDKLLTAEQARIAVDILTMREFEFRRLRDSDKSLFLDGAKEFVDRVRIEVFSAHLRRRLKASNWRVIRLFDTSARRRDLILQSPHKDDPTQHHVIPVFALKAETTLLDQPCSRLESKPQTKGKGGRFLVVPPRSKSKLPSEADGAIGLVTIDNLLKQIGSPG
jgi:hypothetical protein